METSIIDVWGYDREFCSSSPYSSSSLIMDQALKFCRSVDIHMEVCNVILKFWLIISK